MAETLYEWRPRLPEPARIALLLAVTVAATVLVFWLWLRPATASTPAPARCIPHTPYCALPYAHDVCIPAGCFHTNPAGYPIGEPIQPFPARPTIAA